MTNEEWLHGRIYKIEKRSDMSIRKVTGWNQQLINCYKIED